MEANSIYYYIHLLEGYTLLPCRWYDALTRSREQWSRCGVRERLLTAILLHELSSTSSCLIDGVKMMLTVIHSME